METLEVKEGGSFCYYWSHMIYIVLINHFLSLFTMNVVVVKERSDCNDLKKTLKLDIGKTYHAYNLWKKIK